MECDQGPYKDQERTKKKRQNCTEVWVASVCWFCQKLKLIYNFPSFFMSLSEHAALLIYNLAFLSYVLMLYIFHRYVLLFSWIKETSILNLPPPLWRRGDIIDLHLLVGHVVNVTVWTQVCQEILVRFGARICPWHNTLQYLCSSFKVRVCLGTSEKLNFITEIVMVTNTNMTSPMSKMFWWHLFCALVHLIFCI